MPEGVVLVRWDNLLCCCCSSRFGYYQCLCGFDSVSAFVRGVALLVSMEDRQGIFVVVVAEVAACDQNKLLQ